MIHDVAIVGAGPAGATCAAFCAQAGLSTLVLDRARFPREKVCGDCLNPACWPVLERLGVAATLQGLPHARLREVEFAGVHGRPLRFPLPDSDRGEIAIKRSMLDHVLLERAAELGADVCQGTSVTHLEPGWCIHTSGEIFYARILVAADGRNSTVARLLRLLPAARKDRVALQAHLPAPHGFGEKVVMRLLPGGYCGAASVGAGQLNLCLVGKPGRLGQLKAWAASAYPGSEHAAWQTVTPLSRKPVPPDQDDLLMVGDAARVVEPFTGEGIYYALATGEAAARAIIAGDPAAYGPAHEALYRGRLWVNRLARQAVLHPRIASAALALARLYPNILGMLTAKVTRLPALPPAPTASAKK